jgi:transcriptional regulator with XRE-family HTH domain
MAIIKPILEVEYIQYGGIEMNTLNRIRQLQQQRKWTDYKLSKESGVAQSTLRNMFIRSTAPTIPTLEAICKGFGITLSQFFAESNEAVELNNEQRQMFEKWNTLSTEQKKLLFELIENMN